MGIDLTFLPEAAVDVDKEKKIRDDLYSNMMCWSRVGVCASLVLGVCGVGVLSVVIYQQLSFANFRTENNVDVFNSTLLNANLTCGDELSDIVNNYTDELLCPVGETILYNITQTIPFVCKEVLTRYCSYEEPLALPADILGDGAIISGVVFFVSVGMVLRAMKKTWDHQIVEEVDVEHSTVQEESFISNRM